jgi:hypothetical protein
MQRIFQNLAQRFIRLVRREPTLRLGADMRSDWLPPVLGPGDWSSGLMASMADRSTAWYFDRAA